jgi:hypothetical protein
VDVSATDERLREPLTAAGRFYLERMAREERAFRTMQPVGALITDHLAEARDAVLAIEDEALANPVAPLDVERLAKAMRIARQAVAWTPEAKDIAAEYERLGRE